MLVVLLWPTVTRGASLQQIALAVSLSPAMEQPAAGKTWSIGLSLAAEWEVRTATEIEITVSSDAEATSPRFKVAARRFLDNDIALGAGIDLAWTSNPGGPRATAAAFLLAGIHADLTEEFSVTAELAQRMIALVRRDDLWQIGPVTPIPALALSGDLALFAQSAVGGCLVLEPIWVDVQTLENPITQISEHLLLHPTFAFLLDYRP